MPALKPMSPSAPVDDMTIPTDVVAAAVEHAGEGHVLAVRDLHAIRVVPDDVVHQHVVRGELVLDLRQVVLGSQLVRVLRGARAGDALLHEDRRLQGLAGAEGVPDEDLDRGARVHVDRLVERDELLAVDHLELHAHRAQLDLRLLQGVVDDGRDRDRIGASRRGRR